MAEVIHHRLRDDHSPGAMRPALDWPAQLAGAGLRPSGTRTFLLDLPAPVAPPVRRWLTMRLSRTRSWLVDGDDGDRTGRRHVSADDLRAIDRLLDSDDTLGLAQRPDLFLLSAATVHTARRPSGRT